MHPIFSMFYFLVLIVALSSVKSAVRRKRFNAMPKTTYPRSVFKRKPVPDLFQAYSLKNKECHEHEVKVSASDPKPKRRRSFWNEPSWDDELYDKK